MAETGGVSLPGSENWKWLPSSWADEICPAYQQDINAFAHKQEDGTFLLTPPKDGGFHKDEWHTATLEGGEVIEFDAIEEFEDYELTVFEDGFRTLPGATIRANLFQVRDGDHDHNDYDTFDSFEELVEKAGPGGGFRHNPDRLQPGKYTVRACWHSPNSYHFRFEIDNAGNGRFVLQDVH